MRRILMVLMAALLVMPFSSAQDRKQEEKPKKQQKPTAKQLAAMTQTKQLELACSQFRMAYGRFPETLQDLVERPKDLKEDKWPEGGFLIGGKVPKDPWGNEYAYKVKSDSVAITSYGADGKAGGEGEAQDVSNSPTTKSKRSRQTCEGNLSTFYKGLFLYVAKYGGPLKNLPNHVAGKEVWKVLIAPNTNVLNAVDGKSPYLTCPSSGKEEGTLTYRGPKGPWKIGDNHKYLACDEPENHAGGIHALTSDGTVEWLEEGSDAYKNALEDTSD